MALKRGNDIAWIRQTYIFGNDEVILQVDDSDQGLRWRMAVNGDESVWFKEYRHIYVHRGYAVATDFYEPMFQPWTPFKVSYAVRKMERT